MKISIITVTYNSGKTLRDTIESILRQTYEDIECIIVDGLSKDNTIDIIKEYEPIFKSRLKWISERDAGIYDAMNKGITMASGDVVGILNSDDYLSNNNIIGTIAKEFSGNVDMVYGDTYFVNSDNLNKCVRYYSSKIFKPSLMKLGFMPAHPSCYIKKECFKKYGLYRIDFKIASDFELLLRFILINKIRIKYIQKAFVVMRTGGVSTEGFSSRKQIFIEHKKALKDNNVSTNSLLLSLRYIYKIYELIFLNKNMI